MVYLKTIKTSGNWVCPKTGVYKVVCIGGGGAGYGATNGTIARGESGKATSFGSYVSAAGGSCGLDTFGNVKASLYKKGSIWGLNGYNGVSAYGTQAVEAVGVGYGASGGGAGGDLYHAGLPGEITSVILDITEGTSIACTVGEGGKSDGDAANSAVYSYSGKAGAIIVQYLCESM